MNYGRALTVIAVAMVVVGIAGGASGYYTYGVLVDTEDVVGNITVADIEGADGSTNDTTTPTPTPTNDTTTPTPEPTATPTPEPTATPTSTTTSTRTSTATPPPATETTASVTAVGLRPEERV
ncbi:MAG: hypothetical protein V5A27_09265 [Halapricum sp.]